MSEAIRDPRVVERSRFRIGVDDPHPTSVPGDFDYNLQVETSLHRDRSPSVVVLEQHGSRGVLPSGESPVDVSIRSARRSIALERGPESSETQMSVYDHLLNENLI